MNISTFLCLLFCIFSFVIIPLYKLRKSKKIREDNLIGNNNADVLYSAANFIDRGDYVELKIPLGRIKMIQKSAKRVLKFAKAEEYAQDLSLGGFSDWVLPTQEELYEVFKIKDLAGIMSYSDYTNAQDYHWSSSRSGDKFVAVDLLSGRTMTTGSWSGFALRCVRYYNPKNDVTEYEIDKYGNIKIR